MPPLVVVWRRIPAVKPSSAKALRPVGPADKVTVDLAVIGLITSLVTPRIVLDLTATPKPVARPILVARDAMVSVALTVMVTGEPASIATLNWSPAFTPVVALIRVETGALMTPCGRPS